MPIGPGVAPYVGMRIEDLLGEDELPNPDLVITTIPEPAIPALAFAGLVSLMLRRFATPRYPRNPALCSAGAIQSIARRGASP